MLVSILYEEVVNLFILPVDSEEWDFIVDIKFLCKVKDGVILKNLWYYVDFISSISEKEYVVNVP